MKKYKIHFVIEMDEEYGDTQRSVFQYIEAETLEVAELFAKRLGRVIGCFAYHVTQAYGP